MCLTSRVPAHRCVLIENAIEAGQYRRQAPIEEAKRRLGFAPQRLLVGAVGRLSDEKNFAGLVGAADRLLGQGLDLQLIIVGEGDYRPELEKLIADLGRGDRVCLLGYRSDMIEVYEAMDIFVLSSLREGLPNVLLEALAMEVPAIATRIAGVPRLICHDANGLLIQPGNLDQLAEALRRLLCDAELRTRLAASGRKTIEQSYTFEARMAKVRAVYDDLLRENGKCKS